MLSLANPLRRARLAAISGQVSPILTIPALKLSTHVSAAPHARTAPRQLLRPLPYVAQRPPTSVTINAGPFAALAGALGCRQRAGIPRRLPWEGGLARTLARRRMRWLTDMRGRQGLGTQQWRLAWAHSRSDPTIKRVKSCPLLGGCAATPLRRAGLRCSQQFSSQAHHLFTSLGQARSKFTASSLQLSIRLLQLLVIRPTALARSLLSLALLFSSVAIVANCHNSKKNHGPKRDMYANNRETV